MNTLEVKRVPFMGTDLMAARDDEGTIWAGVSYICNGLGLSKTNVGRIIGRTPRTVGKYLQFGGTVTRPMLSRAQLARQIAELTRYQA